MYNRLNFGLPHPALAGSLGLARRIGVRAQFGDALLGLRAALGRIGIRPQICYGVAEIDRGDGRLSLGGRFQSGRRALAWTCFDCHQGGANGSLNTIIKIAISAYSIRVVGQFLV